MIGRYILSVVMAFFCGYLIANIIWQNREQNRLMIEIEHEKMEIEEIIKTNKVLKTCEQYQRYVIKVKQDSVNLLSK